jgi:hypothetical protein
MDLFAREPVIEQAQQVVGEVLPLIVLRDLPTRRSAVAAGVVPQQPSAAEPSTEVEVEHPIARTARRKSVQLDYWVSTLVAQSNRQVSSGNLECGHESGYLGR